MRCKSGHARDGRAFLLADVAPEIGMLHLWRLALSRLPRCLRKAPGLKDLDCSENRLDDDRAKIIVEVAWPCVIKRT